ncbi:MAG: hypothetical protein AVDCRST_MAG64-3203, partial [uncultured Phycisphaerae bacterium]
RHPSARFAPAAPLRPSGIVARGRRRRAGGGGTRPVAGRVV